MTQDRQEDGSYGSTLIKGAAIMVAMRWIMRLIGLVGISITARLLSPEDYGVFGSIHILIAFLYVFAFAGIDDQLIRLPKINDDYINTGWSLMILIHFFMAGVLLLTAPFVGTWVGDERVGALVPFFAIAIAIRGFVNPITGLCLRDFDYDRVFRYNLSCKLARFVINVSAAWWLGNYWAFVVMEIAGNLVQLIASFALKPRWPRFSLVKRVEMFGYSLRTMGQALALYITGTVDRVAVRSTADTAIFGLYHNAAETSRVMITEFVLPVGRAMSPGFAKMQEERERLRSAVQVANGVTIMFAFAVGAGVSIVAEEFVRLLLGSQWVGMIPFVTVFAIGAAFENATAMSNAALNATNRPGLLASLRLARALVLGIVVAYLAIHYDILTLIWGFVAVAAFFMILELVVLGLVFGGLANFLLLIVRPAIAASTMWFAIHLCPFPPDWPLAILLVLKAGLGSIIFGMTLLISWILVGRPGGPERELLRRVPGRFQRFIPFAL